MRSHRSRAARPRTRAGVSPCWYSRSWPRWSGQPKTAALARPTVAGKPRLEATIFSYDGGDFVRTHSTLMTEGGKPAVNTKLDRATPAFKALAQKHSFSGEVTVFGKRYDGNYAPLTDASGRLTGALFVGVPR